MKPEDYNKFVASWNSEPIKQSAASDAHCAPEA